MKNPVLILLLACVASVSFIGWRVHEMSTQTVNHLGLVYDPSFSYTEGCRSILGSAEELLRNSSVSPNSTLTVLVLGDDFSAHEPRKLAEYSIPTSRKVIEGRLANVRRQQSVLHDLWEKCTAVRPTTISPIFLGVKQAVADLRGHGCGEGSQCELRVNSDLEENVERTLKGRINHAREGKVPLPNPLDNSGIQVTFCGFAATAGRIVDPSGREIRRPAARDPNYGDRLQDAWRRMFARPELVGFEPYCPKPSNSQAHETADVPKESVAP
jgi:hypothetical protein